jgi:predicted Ser/Thr protein kinase
VPEKVGKYEIVERIGRGGMGLVFKAHDPVLDRFVALKVISTEADVTDELRTRFFREAQACAKLSHPNIVTVYDMGEDQGRLFFVMELLEGEELRKLISQKKALSLEDKLSVMIQVCDGLHYAHQRGIVHRDIKPGNIMLLRNGQVKILDFGIAQIASTDGGLTRTGLIMGTLRYIAPEQVRGRADHRSDIFSIGAVTYELLGLRPPFTGDDPMQLLEQLRTEDPTPLSEVDPTLPAELSAIVHRAMQKDPEQRFQDLEEMRNQLEVVQRGLAEEAQQVRARLRSHRERLRQLQTALTERVGPAGEDDTVVAIDERARLTTMRAIESEFTRRIETLHARIVQADALAPALQRGVELLDAGQFADAVLEFEAIVAEMPEHGRAVELLKRARAQAEAHRRQQIGVRFVEEAQAAFDAGEFSLCLEILAQALDASTPAEAAQEFAALRRRAEGGLAAQQAARRLREQAERAREEMTRKRYLARAAIQHAPELWAVAERKLTVAQAAFDDKVFGPALEAFNEATSLYAKAEEAVHEGRRQERRRAEEAQERATQGQRGATAVDADRLATTLWGDAAARAAEAHAAFAQEQYVKAAEAFDAALVLYRRAENQARQLRRRQREEAEQKRQAMTERRRAAEGVVASSLASAEWSEAEAVSMVAETAFGRESYEEAGEAFDRAAALYRRSEDGSREAQRRLEAARVDAEKARQAATLARRAASEANAAKYAAGPWALGETAEANAGDALGRLDHAGARALFGEARRHYAAAAEAAGVAAEAEARRVDAMLRDARRLLQTGDAEASLRRLTEVLTLKPGHSAAQTLRAEVEEAMRQAAAAEAARARQPIDPPTVAAELTVLTPPGGVSKTPTVSAEPLVAKPPAVPAEPVTAKGRSEPPAPKPPAVPAEPVVTAPAAAAAAAGATVVGDATGATRPGRTIPSGPAVDDSRTRGAVAATRPPAKRRLAPVAIAVAGGCAAIVLGGYLWLSRSTPDAAPSPQTASVPVARPAEPPARPSVTEAPVNRTTVAREVPTKIDAVANARAAEKQAAEARRVAELADAPRLARPLWAKAGSAQQRAEEAVKQHAYDRAETLFGDAEKTYRVAEKAAIDKAATDKVEKLAAEKAAAERAASERAAAAERERAASAQRQQLEAEQAREREARRESETQQRQVALLRANAEESRGRAVSRREQAVKADAERFAKDVFHAAEAKLSEADGQVKSQSFAAASRAYHDAADRYVEASMRAQGVREAKATADAAKTRMLLEKERANDGAPEFGAAVAEEKQGNTLYDKLAYKDAAERFRSAEVLFSKVPPRSEPPRSRPSQRPRSTPAPF